MVLTYRYRFVEFPLKVGDGVYAGISMEAGNLWTNLDDATTADLEYANSLYLGVDTSTYGPTPTHRKTLDIAISQLDKIKSELEAAGIDGDPNLAYALHLARRGYVTLAPDYPGFGESRYDFGVQAIHV